MSTRDLRDLATRATPGPWDAVVLGSEGYDVRATREGLRRRLRIARFGYEEWETDRSNAEFIAAANPQRVLGLLDDLAAAESRVADLDRIVNDYIRIGTVDQCAEWKARALADETTRSEATR